MRPTKCFLAILLWAAFTEPAQEESSYDVLIRGGQIVDGTGNPWFHGDIGIRGGRIATIGRLDEATAVRIIEAEGLVVAPGFIDLHTHSDYSLLVDGLAQSKVRQGVTLDVLGESTTVAPRDGLTERRDSRSGVEVDWMDFAGYFERIE